jgi:hypothetical protein
VRERDLEREEMGKGKEEKEERGVEEEGKFHR